MLSQKAVQAICHHIIRVLREEREQKGISKYTVALKSGLSQQMISYVERGLRNPSLETIVRMASAIEVDLAEIIKEAFAAHSRSPKK